MRKLSIRKQANPKLFSAIGGGKIIIIKQLYFTQKLTYDISEYYLEKSSLKISRKILELRTKAVGF